MKQITILIAGFLLSLNVIGQCNPPELVNWTALDSTIFSISFTSEIEATYELEIRLDYGLSEDPGGIDIIFDTLVLSGPTLPGVNIITLDVDSSVITSNYAIYYTARLRLQCEPNVYSDYTKFYLSPHSIASNPNFICDSLYMPFTYLADGAGFSYATIIDIPESTEVIDSIEVFLDIGHTWANDLGIKLIHPNGNEIILHEPNNPYLGGKFGFSVLFSDYAPGPITLPLPNGPSGYYQPIEPLSSLVGESISGEWIIVVTDYAGGDDGMVFGVCLNIVGAPCLNSIAGKTFFDLNGNSVQDIEEPVLPYAHINNTITEEQFYSYSSGNYWSCTDPGSGNLEILNTPDYFQSIPLSVKVNDNTQLTGLDLPLTLVDGPVIDLVTDIFSTEPNRPGFEATYEVMIDNLGGICEETATLNINFPDFVEITESTNPNITLGSNSTTLNLNDLCPYTPLFFYLTVVLDTDVELGTILQASAEIIPTNLDADMTNNFYLSEVTVVGAYDPNDKHVSHTAIGSEFLANGEALKYTIRFQNTGTFYAERVVIADTIDTHLDLNSLRILSTSHDMQLSREGNILYFEFDQIFLPDSAADLEGSIGHVRYEIDPLPSFAEGDFIENTAYIYFDFNEPIITNTVLTIFQEPVGNQNHRDFGTVLYPNPTSQNLNVSWSDEFEVDRIHIIDLSGRIVRQYDIATGFEVVLDIDDLDNGLYILEITSKGQTSTERFVKQN